MAALEREHVSPTTSPASDRRSKALLAGASLAAGAILLLLMQAWLRSWQEGELERAALFWNGYAKLYVEETGGWDGLQERLRADGYMLAGQSLSVVFYPAGQPDRPIALTEGAGEAWAAKKLPVLSSGKAAGYTEVRLHRSRHPIAYMLPASAAAALAVWLAGCWHLRRLERVRAEARCGLARTFWNRLTEDGQEERAGRLAANVETLPDLRSRAEAAVAAAGEELDKLKIRLAKLETVRRTMVADIAHELRTPLAVMRTKLEHAIGAGQPLELEKLLPLHDETLRLSRLVRDLQELALAESGHLPLSKSWFSLSGLADDVLETLAVYDGERQISAERTGAEEVRIYADMNRIRGVLINLIGNAFHHARSAVTVHVELNGAGEAVFVVRDDGLGIEEEERERVFERFYRGQTHQDRRRKTGLGLGLAIVKEFVHAHGGTAAVESAYGQGTSFMVRLPVFSDS